MKKFLILCALLFAPSIALGSWNNDDLVDFNNAEPAT